MLRKRLFWLVPLLLALVGLPLQTWAIGADGAYFVQDFEDQSTYPDETGKEANVELKFDVPGQGEWIYYNSYVSTNTKYNANGSTKNLRLPKNGSYVITPVLSFGVKTVTYYGPRKGERRRQHLDNRGANQRRQ